MICTTGTHQARSSRGTGTWSEKMEGGALSQVLRFLKKFYSLKYKIYNLVTNRTALSHPTSAISIRCDVMPVVPMPDIGSFWSTKVHTVQLRSQTLNRPGLFERTFLSTPLLAAAAEAAPSASTSGMSGHSKVVAAIRSVPFSGGKACCG